MPRPPSDQMFQLLDALESQPATMSELSSVVNAPISTLNAMLDRLRYAGTVQVVEKRRVEHCKRPVSVYALARN